MPVMQVEEAVELIQMEYQEMPQLRLTFWQARRLWNLSDDLCERALSALTGSGFLARASDGAPSIAAEAVGNARHLIAAHDVPGRQDRVDLDPGSGGHEVRRLWRVEARTAVRGPADGRERARKDRNETKQDEF